MLYSRSGTGEAILAAFGVMRLKKHSNWDCGMRIVRVPTLTPFNVPDLSHLRIVP